MKRFYALFAVLVAAQAVCGLLGYLVVKNMLRALESLVELLGGE